jgi:hypothetical protein
MMVAVFALTFVAKGAMIGPWPLEQPYLWDTQPIKAPSGYIGGESNVDPPGGLNRLNMPVSTAAAKNASWLPYPTGYAGERM